MANITGNVAAHITALTATTVQTFVLNDAHDSVTVTVRGTAADVYFTTADNAAPTAPTVGGTDCYVAPGVVGGSKTVFTGAGGPTQVSVISSGTPGVSVEGGVGSLVRET